MSVLFSELLYFSLHCHLCSLSCMSLYFPVTLPSVCITFIFETLSSSKGSFCIVSLLDPWFLHALIHFVQENSHCLNSSERCCLLCLTAHAYWCDQLLLAPIHPPYPGQAWSLAPLSPDVQAPSLLKTNPSVALSSQVLSFPITNGLYHWLLC